VTVKEALSRGREALAASGIEDPWLEAEVLLRHTLNIDRVQQYLTLNEELNPRKYEIFWKMVERRLNGEPAAYVTGHREFYGLDFYIDENVLIPRPESELLVEKTLELTRRHTLSTIADIGTGCGAIAISLAFKLPQIRVYATDISSAALGVARFNCQKHDVSDRICLLEGDLLAALPEPVDLIAANLPYVSSPELAQSRVLSFEPSLALDGGRDGLEKIGILGRQAADKLNPGGFLLLEVGQGQSRAVTTLLRGLHPRAEVEVTADLNGIDRVVSLNMPSDNGLAREQKGNQFAGQIKLAGACLEESHSARNRQIA